MKQTCWALEYANEELKNDREIVLTAVKKCGNTLQFASEALRNDREIVMIAVQQELYGWQEGDGTALEYASEELKNDREVVMAAVQWNG